MMHNPHFLHKQKVFQLEDSSPNIHPPLCCLVLLDVSLKNQRVIADVRVLGNESVFAQRLQINRSPDSLCNAGNQAAARHGRGCEGRAASNKTKEAGDFFYINLYLIPHSHCSFIGALILSLLKNLSKELSLICA